MLPRRRLWAIGGMLAAGGLAAAACSGGGSGDENAIETTAEQSQRDGASPAPTEPEEAGADAVEPFLPLDVTTTPAGDPIFRDPTEPHPSGVRWNTNWDIRIIDLQELLSGGPPRDGIPPLDEPKFVDITTADEYYKGNSPVIQFEVNGDVRAYPLAIMTWHEIVNDVVGGVPVSVTFCPLCNSAIAFERTVGERVLTFGTSGLLRRSDLVMWDRQTESLWQQIGARALVGDLVGVDLTLLPAPIVSWQQFKENFPDGLVLSRDTGFRRQYGANPYTGYDDINDSPFLFIGEVNDRLSPFERVATVQFESEVVAYPFPLLQTVRLYEDTRNGDSLVVFWTPGTSSALDTSVIDQGREVGSTGVFSREIDGETLSFMPNPDDDQTFLDTDTSSAWNIFGTAVSGPRAGAQLTPIVHANHFWFAWAAFMPDTVIVTGAGDNDAGAG